MSRKTRRSLIDPDQVTIAHVVAKTARNLFLLGVETQATDYNSHRKDWIVDILEFQSSLMAIDLLDYCLLSNHIHQILRSRPDAVKEWTDEEVARRWLNLCPKSKKCLKVGDKVHRVPIPPKETQIQALANNEKKIKDIRERLSSISWWMRLLCQKVAQRANFEDGGSMGPFWKGRFHSTIIEDTDHLLGCALYVDLNAVKASMARGIDDYKYTSAKVRLDRLRSTEEALQKQEVLKADSVLVVDSPGDVSSAEGCQAKEEKGGDDESGFIPGMSKGEFLSAIKLESMADDPQLHDRGFRCSDKGFLEYSEREYFDALEWCIRNKITERESTDKLPGDIPECIQKHRFGPKLVIRQAKEFDQMYRYRTCKEPDASGLLESGEDSVE
ncbi:MAG: hypothetical protein ACKO3V_13880 [Pirellula sp.]